MHSPRDENGDLIGDEEMLCEINGKLIDDLADKWPWFGGKPVSIAEFRSLKAAARTRDVRKPIDLLNDPVPFGDDDV